MILTVTLNPAIDLTYTIQGELEPDHSHRVQTVQSRPGGKGVNVARVLTALGVPATAVGPGDDSFGALLATHGVLADFPPLLAQVRRSVAVVAPSTTTVLNEPGTHVVPGAGARLAALVARHLDEAQVLVVSGSVAPGLSPDLAVHLASQAAHRGVPSVLDLDDAALQAAAHAGGSVLMPNEHELARLLGVDAVTERELPGAVRALAIRNRAPVVATLGSRGLLAAADGDLWQASPPAKVAGNPTGAGDATAAGVALGLARSMGWAEVLSHAVALGAAAVLAPVAGEVDLAAYHRWRGEVAVRRLDSHDPTLQES